MIDLQLAELTYPSGTIHFRYARYLSADGSEWVRHGMFRAYYEEGTLSSEGNYEHGKEHGLWCDYHLNGQLAAKGNYVNGSEVGTWQYWSVDGTLESPGAA